MLALLAVCAPQTCAQTYTAENAPGVTAYSAFAGSPAGSTYAPYTYNPPPSPVAGEPGPVGCSGPGGDCVPVSVAGTAATGLYLMRDGAPYWFTCVPHAAALSPCLR